MPEPPAGVTKSLPNEWIGIWEYLIFRENYENNNKNDTHNKINSQNKPRLRSKNEKDMTDDALNKC